jgi:chromosome segregation ATPase
VNDLTDQVNALTGRVNDLTDQVNALTGRVNDLTDQVNVLTQEVRELTRSMREMQGEIGGISKTLGYSLENEAYRMLPAFLEKHYNITLTRRLIRTEIGGREINLFAEGEQEGHPITLVGEARNRLDERRKKQRKSVFADLEERVAGVVDERDLDPRAVVRVLVTHYARPGIVEEARNRNIIIVQSFEW